MKGKKCGFILDRQTGSKHFYYKLYLGHALPLYSLENAELREGLKCYNFCFVF
jgi:hypothetical protein